MSGERIISPHDIEEFEPTATLADNFFVELGIPVLPAESDNPIKKGRYDWNHGPRKEFNLNSFIPGERELTEDALIEYFGIGSEKLKKVIPDAGFAIGSLVRMAAFTEKGRTSKDDGYLLHTPMAELAGIRHKMDKDFLEFLGIDGSDLDVVTHVWQFPETVKRRESRTNPGQYYGDRKVKRDDSEGELTVSYHTPGYNYDEAVTDIALTHIVTAPTIFHAIRLVEDNGKFKLVDPFNAMGFNDAMNQFTGYDPGLGLDAVNPLVLPELTGMKNPLFRLTRLTFACAYLPFLDRSFEGKQTVKRFRQALDIAEILQLFADNRPALDSYANTVWKMLMTRQIDLDLFEQNASDINPDFWKLIRGVYDFAYERNLDRIRSIPDGHPVREYARRRNYLPEDRDEVLNKFKYVF